MVVLSMILLTFSAVVLSAILVPRHKRLVAVVAYVAVVLGGFLMSRSVWGQGELLVLATGAGIGLLFVHGRVPR